MVTQTIGVSRSAMKNNNQRRHSAYERNKHNSVNTAATRECVSSFFCRDGNSRATAGGRETVTRDRKAKEKRYLLKTVPYLYKEFAVENPVAMISESSFTRQKPFWVKMPKIHERETCLCKRHEKPAFQIHAFQIEGFATSRWHLR